MNVAFPRQQQWEPGWEYLEFPAEVDGGRVACRITLEAVGNRARGERADPAGGGKRPSSPAARRLSKRPGRRSSRPDGRSLRCC